MMILKLVMFLAFFKLTDAKCNQISPNPYHFASIRQVKEQCRPKQGSLAVMSSYVLIMPMIISLLCDLHGRFSLPVKITFHTQLSAKHHIKQW